MTTPTSHLFYYEDGVYAYIPVPAAADTPALRALVGFENMADGDEAVIRFRCVDLTDEQMERLPEA